MIDGQNRHPALLRLLIFAGQTENLRHHFCSSVFFVNNVSLTSIIAKSWYSSEPACWVIASVNGRDRKYTYIGCVVNVKEGLLANELPLDYIDLFHNIDSRGQQCVVSRRPFWRRYCNSVHPVEHRQCYLDSSLL